MEKQVIILLGKSGSGKGTQAELLKEKLGFAHVVSGDLLRARAKKTDFTGKKLADVLKNGGLAPMAVIFKLWLDRIERLFNKKSTKGFILDGNPRRINEAYLIDEVFGWYDIKNLKVVLIDISDEDAIFRMGKRKLCSNKKCGNIIPFNDETKDLLKCPKCGRKLIARNDDRDPGAVSKRLEWFKTDVQPIVDYYKETGRLHVIDGIGTIDEIFNRVQESIK